MSRNKFNSLPKFIRFDDYLTIEEKNSKDKLAPIRNVFNLFV